MKKIDIAIKLLESPQARKIATSPHAKRLVVKVMKNEKVREAVVKQVTKRLFAR